MALADHDSTLTLGLLNQTDEGRAVPSANHYGLEKPIYTVLLEKKLIDTVQLTWPSWLSSIRRLHLLSTRPAHSQYYRRVSYGLQCRGRSAMRKNLYQYLLPVM